MNAALASDRKHAARQIRGAMKSIANLRTSTQGAPDARACAVRSLLALALREVELVEPEPEQMPLEGVSP